MPAILMGGRTGGELLPGLEQQGYALGFATRVSCPFLHELLPGIAQTAASGVGDVVGALAYPVEHHEVVAVPVKDAREGHMAESVSAHAAPHCGEAEGTGRLGDGEQRDATLGAAADSLHFVDADVAARVVAVDHRKRGCPALHGVPLLHQGEGSANHGQSPSIILSLTL